jgi:hypothetical protein
MWPLGLPARDGYAILAPINMPRRKNHQGGIAVTERHGTKSLLNLFKATIRLAGGSDTCHVVSRDLEDAIRQLREAYEDLNVLYIESVERVGGPLFVTTTAAEVVKS